jgi:hypothetical protein
MAFEQPEMDRKKALLHQNYFTESGGRGFIQQSLDLFPELKPIMDDSYNQLSLSFQSAQTKYIRTLSEIRAFCACTICMGGRDIEHTDRPCFLAIFEAIVIVCQVLSGTIPADNLCLRRSGLEIAYSNAFTAIVRTRQSESPGQGPIGGTEIIRILNESGEGKLLHLALLLFSGRTPSFGGRTSARSSGGICAYLSVLQDFSLDREVLGRVAVVPGHIESDGATFHSIKDVTE